jgi:hypothetical protein
MGLICLGILGILGPGGRSLAGAGRRSVQLDRAEEPCGLALGFPHVDARLDGGQQQSCSCLRWAVDSGEAGLATRCDKTPDSYLAGLHLRGAVLWIRGLKPGPGGGGGGGGGGRMRS